MRPIVTKRADSGECAPDKIACDRARSRGARGVVPPENGSGKYGDAGSIAVFTAVFAFAVLLLLVLLVDGGTVLNGRERAADIAEQAARAAVTDLSIGDLHGETTGGTATSGTATSGTGATVAINWPAACGYAQSTARDYANSLGSSITFDSATCPGQAANSATITVTVTVQPVIPFPGFRAVTVTATQTAAAVCGNADQQEVC